jgi:hypothetical protein
MAIYYLDLSATVNGDGSESSPWNITGSSESTLHDGDILKVKGSYEGAVMHLVQNDGPITVERWVSTEPWRVRINGTFFLPIGYRPSTIEGGIIYADDLSIQPDNLGIAYIRNCFLRSDSSLNSWADGSNVGLVFEGCILVAPYGYNITSINEYNALELKDCIIDIPDFVSPNADWNAYNCVFADSTPEVTGDFKNCQTVWIAPSWPRWVASQSEWLYSTLFLGPSEITLPPNPEYSFFDYINYNIGYTTLDANFSVSKNIGAIPFSVSFTPQILGGNASEYFWEFGDGTTSTEVFPTHTYEYLGKYTVKLTVSNSATLESILIRKTECIIACLIDFEATPIEGHPPLSVKITDNSSVPTGFSIIDRTWDFGDGTTLVSTQNPVHTFSDSGSYAIKLSITLKRI